MIARFRPSLLWILMCAIALCQLLACSSRMPSRPNILLIVADTLRADRLGSYGNTRGLTPFLDTLAEQAHVFRNAYAQSSWTNPSVASLITSRFPSQHGVVSFGSSLQRSDLTLAEALEARGYVTGGFSANGLLAIEKGFGRGYGRYLTLMLSPIWGPTEKKVRAQLVNQNALMWLDSLGGRARQGGVFLHLHYVEPHIPYAPPARFLDRLIRGRERPDVSALNTTAFLSRVVNPDEGQLRDLEDIYDAEVTSLDESLVELFSELTRRGFLNNAIVVITSDHGEEFMEHGSFGHGANLNEEVIRVPLIMMVPGRVERVQVDEVVSLIDVAPTLIDLLDGSPPPSFEGRSLKRALRRREESIRPAYSELLVFPDGSSEKRPAHQRAIIVGACKLITGIHGETEYYDLASDPGEKNPTQLPEQQRVLLQHAVDRFQVLAARFDAAAVPSRIDPQTRERMRALGYVQ